MSKIIRINFDKKQKVDDTVENQFEQIELLNKKKKERLEEERKKHNKQVLRNFRIKPDNNEGA